MPLQILPTDTVFTDSPDSGHPECKCSRCAKQISAREAPILRCFDKDDNTEVRFCWACSKSMGIDFDNLEDKDEEKETYDGPIPDFFDDDEGEGPGYCPGCRKEYDDVDFEYQICHHCGFNANN